MINEFTCTNLIRAQSHEKLFFLFLILVFFSLYCICGPSFIDFVRHKLDTYARQVVPTQPKEKKLCDPKQSKSTETHYFTINFTLNFNFGGSYTLDSRFIMKNCVSLYLLNQNKKRNRTHGGVVFRMHDQTI